MKLTKIIEKIRGTKTVKEYIYVPDFRGRLVYQRMFVPPHQGIGGGPLSYINESEYPAEIVVYRFVGKKKPKNPTKR